MLVAVLILGVFYSLIGWGLLAFIGRLYTRQKVQMRLQEWV